MDSKAVLQAIETNLVNNTQRVSGKLGISVYCGSSILEDISSNIFKDDNNILIKKGKKLIHNSINI